MSNFVFSNRLYYLQVGQLSQHLVDKGRRHPMVQGSQHQMSRESQDQKVGAGGGLQM